MDSRGRIYASFEQVPDELRAFDQAGRPRGRIGSSGAGPREFLDISEIVVTPGDSLYVFDGGNGRVTILSPDWSVARSFPFSGWVSDAVRLDGGELVVNLHRATRELVGVPLHLLAADGHISKSFRVDPMLYRADAPSMMIRTLTPAADGRLWAGHESRYVLELWDRTGEMRTRLTRDADWFEPWDRAPEISPTQPPTPFLRTISVDSSGRIWTAVLVPDKNYRDALGPATVREGQTTYDIVKGPEHLYDTMIEVIDPGAGTVVAHARTGHVIDRWIGDGRLVTYREADGVPVLDVWRIDLTTNRGR